MSDKPLVSILIPCGTNHIQYLDRAVKSAEAQTVPVEVLTYIDHERKGPAYGRNLLAAQARGLFVSFLDADDWVYPQFAETLLADWKPGSYVYSDWHEVDEDGEQQHIEATSCYIDWRYNKSEQRAYHLTPVLFPTRLYHALGGMDESLYSSEDTDFFFKANVAGVTSIRVREPLFFYSSDGGHARSTSGREHPSMEGILRKLFKTYQEKANVACCGDIPKKGDILMAQHLEGDILVRAKWRGNRKVVGRVSGRKYGRHGNGAQLWIDPRDYEADKRFFETGDIDAVAFSPTPEEIQALLLDESAPMAQRVRAGGVRNWATMEKPGFDMQQDPQEIGQFLDFCLENGVQSVLEIGTGESGGLARFMASVLGWDVTSIDINMPETFLSDEPGGVMNFESGGTWDVWQLDSQQPETIGLKEDAAFDLVFIDGDHTAAAVRNDHQNYAQFGRIVAFHDISPEGYWTDVADYWKEIAHTKAGNLRKGYYEALNPHAKTGLGWYVTS